jgi:hypothetical protein
MPSSRSCRTCVSWVPEPWDMCPEQADAYCHHEMRRTPFDYRCEGWAERTNRDFGPAAKKVTP